MRKSIALISCVGALALASASCTSVKNTAYTADVDTKIYNLTVADLKVEKERASKTTSWSWNPFNQINLDREKKNAAAGILRETESDVLVEPQYEIHRRGVFRGGSLTVTGYPAKYSNFRTMNREDAENLAIANGNLTVNSTVAAPAVTNANDIVENVLAGVAVLPGQKYGKSKKALPVIGSRRKKDVGPRRFVSVMGGTTIQGGLDSGSSMNFGLMYGKYGSRWGFYVKGQVYSDEAEGYDYSHYGDDWKKTTFYGTVGVIKTLPFGFNLMAGTGLGGCVGVDADYYYDDDNPLECKMAIPVEGILQWHYKQFNIMGGVTYLAHLGSMYTDNPLNLMVGIGFNF